MEERESLRKEMAVFVAEGGSRPKMVEDPILYLLDVLTTGCCCSVVGRTLAEVVNLQLVILQYIFKI